MSTTVSYKGQTITTVSNDTKTLLTEGKYLEDDLTLTDVSSGGAVLTTKNISANGTYNASSDSADGYSQVTVAVPASAVDSGTKSISANGTHDVVGYASANVNVPNSYSQSDEGKVVSNGALVAQTSDTVTENDTYDTTLINSLTVNVSGGGGTDFLVERCNNTLESYYSPNVTQIRGVVFQNCTSLKSVVLPNLTSIAYYGTFKGCTDLEVCDLGGTLDRIQNNQYEDCRKLTTLVIRKATVCALGNTNAFGNSPFASGKAGGILYVPEALIGSYQGASNWSTILGYATNQIKSIESTHTDPTAPIDLTLYYADGTLIPT